MFGNVARAAWGTSQWGSVLPTPGLAFSADNVCSGDLDRSFDVDALAALIDEESDVAVDAVVQGTGETSFALDAAPALLPPAVYAKLTTKPYVLAEINLPGGPVYVATKCRVKLGRSFEARLVSGGKILRTLSRGSDDLRLELDDTTTSGAQRFRDLFAIDDPEGSIVRVWIGAEGALDAEHQLVFEGKVEQVQGFSDTTTRIQVVRSEQVEDVLLGSLVDAATFPDAPQESVSSMLPIVFGTLAAHAGVVVNTNVVGSASVNVFAQDAFLALVDASEFPAAGTVRIGGELIVYTSKAGNTLAGATRGTGGTTAADHPRGSEVAEVGAFQVKFASHALGYMRRFKLRLPTGNLGDPVPQPTTIDPVNALATWAEGLPQIRDPDARPTYQRVHFKDPDLVFNTATNPQFSARENPGYQAFRVSQIQAGAQLVLRTNTEGLGQPGDISRAWIGVLFDPLSVAGFSAYATIGTSLHVLTPFDNVPDEIARNDERTGDRIYDVPPPVLSVSAASTVDFSATPQEVVDAGLFITEQRAGLVVDKDDSSFACYAFVGFGEAIISGGGDVVYRWTQQEWEAAFPAGSKTISLEIRALMGSTVVPITSPWIVFLRLDGVEIANTRLSCQTLAPAGFGAGFIQGVEEFKKTITGAFDPQAAGVPDGSGGTLNIWDRLEMVLQPVTGVSTGFWCAAEVSIQGVGEPPVPIVDATQDVRQSVTNYFEVTDQLLVVNGEKSWTSFSNVLSLGRARFQGTGGEPRIVETFWVVEFTPFVQASSRVPFVAADVAGLVPSGNPVEIARSLVERAAPEGLGLPADRIDQGSYMDASASLAADGVRADFAISGQASAVDALSELASQTDCRETWETNQHRIVRLPRADTLLPVARNLTKGDYLEAGPGVSEKSIGRNSARDVANKITVKWKHYSPSGQTSQVETLNDLPSQALALGVREAVLELSLLQSSTAALLVAQRKLERLRVPRWIVEVDVPIYGLAYRAGDLVSSNDPDFTFRVGEITQVNLNTDRLKRTRIQIAVWLK